MLVKSGNDRSKILKLIFALKDPYPVLMKLLESNPPVDPKSPSLVTKVFDFNKFCILQEVIAVNPPERALQLLQMILDSPISQQLDFNSRDVEGLTPLMRAIQKNNLDIVRELLNAGANPKLKEAGRGWTALHMAAAMKGNINPEIIKLLLAKGARADEFDQEGSTPMDLASGNIEVLDLMSGAAIGPDSNVDPIRHEKTFRAFHDRVDAIKKVKMSQRLFAHIHLDAKLLGTTLQGSIMSVTSRYALECMNLYLKTHGKELNEAETKSLNAAIQRFTILSDLTKDYELATEEGRRKLDGIKKNDENATLRREIKDKITSELVEKIAKSFEKTGSISCQPGGEPDLAGMP